MIGVLTFSGQVSRTRPSTQRYCFASASVLSSPWNTSSVPPKGAAMTSEQIGGYCVGRGSGTERELHLPGLNDVPTGQRRIASFRDIVVEYLDFIANPAQDRYES